MLCGISHFVPCCVAPILYIFTQAFGPTVFLQMLFLALRAGLSICQDFNFLAKSACITFVAVYTPAILIAKFTVDDKAVAYYVAMYIPHFAMIAIFAWRMLHHLRALLNGDPGPWSSHMRSSQTTSARPDEYRLMDTDHEPASSPPTRQAVQ